MFLPCRDYLLAKLVEAGLKTKPLTSTKELERTAESHIGAVIFESDDFLRNGSKRIYVDKTGATVKRRLVFERSMVFSVVIGDYTQEQVAVMVDRFVSSLDRGLPVGGQYIPIEVDSADWVDGADSILQSKLAAQIKVKFLGAIYQDTSFSKLQAVEITSIEQEETAHGE